MRLRTLIAFGTVVLLGPTALFAAVGGIDTATPQSPNPGLPLGSLKPDLALVGWPTPGVLYMGGTNAAPNTEFIGSCSTSSVIHLDADSRLRITSKGELVYRFRFKIINRGLTPAETSTSRLRTTNLGVNNTAAVQSVARLNPGETTTQTFEMPFLLMYRNTIDIEFSINYNDRVRETTRRNNSCRMKLDFINNKYDFAIQSFRFNRMAPTCVPGQPVYYFDVTVKNEGSGWLAYGPIVNTLPLVVEDTHAPFYGNPYPGWGGIVGLLDNPNHFFKPGEVKQFQIGVGYHRNDPAHMRRGPSHPFQAFVRGSGVKSATLSIQPPTACRGGQPAQLKGSPARSQNKKSAPLTVEPIPAKPLPRR